MLKIQLDIAETKKAIEESEQNGLAYIEVVANAVPVPPGWMMVKVPDPIPELGHLPSDQLAN